MGKVIMIVRIMPEDSSVNLDELVSEIERNLPERVELASTKIEPFAFGMSVLETALTMPDEEGFSEKIEEYLKSLEGVGEIEVVALTRL